MAYKISTLILAAGEGRRLAEVTGGTPKQFWRGPGGRTLLEDTIARFSPLAPLERMTVVIGRHHRRYVDTGPVELAGTIAEQPADRGTAAGVLLGLTHLPGEPHEDVVILTPSDHGVADTRGFRRLLVEVIRHVQTHDEIVVLGAQPLKACSDYGWITPGEAAPAARLRPIASFVEKPAPEAARRLREAGAAWNTMVVVARRASLLGLFARLLPDLYAEFVEAVADRERRPERLEAAYAAMDRSYDFSRDVLGQARGLATCILPASLGWTDLGTPERLRQWHSRLDPTPDGPKDGVEHVVSAA
jgi:mannose-1-phosphate guanylyltransferase